MFVKEKIIEENKNAIKFVDTEQISKKYEKEKIFLKDYYSNKPHHSADFINYRELMESINSRECSELIYFHKPEPEDEGYILIGNLITYEVKEHDFSYYDLYYYQYNDFTFYVAKFGNFVEQKFRACEDFFQGGVWIPSEAIQTCRRLCCLSMGKDTCLTSFTREQKTEALEKFHTKLKNLRNAMSLMPISPYMSMINCDVEKFHTLLVELIDWEVHKDKDKPATAKI